MSAFEAKLNVEGEYEVYRQRQDAEYVSDFDREIKPLEGTHQKASKARRDQEGTNGR